MKKLTNYAAGPRGIMQTSGNIHWLNPGESHSFEASEIVLPLPDLGDKPAAVDPDEVSQIEALTAERDELKQQVADQGNELTALRADLEKATKPAK
ncbi:MAG: hypothetical protein EOO77_13600 [Oxalobacteraceae bacterium]|nr:MAG: hypothetical protein EOO77_13600 [Oxalobacteraceae bacterium]